MALPGSNQLPLISLLYELRRVRSVLGRAEERLGDVIDSIDSGRPLGAHSDVRVVRKCVRKYADRSARDAAARGVRSVTWRIADARTVMVSIDSGAEFTLSPSLADLLAVIAAADTADPDGFVVFQPLQKVVSMMIGRGRRSSRRAVIVGISRLRQRLERLNYPPLLVETSVRLGVRFRLRLVQPC